jgi:hypothetical protein
MKKHSVVLCSLVSLFVSVAHADRRGFRHYPGYWWPRCEDSVEAVSTMIAQNIDSITSACESDPLRLERTADGSLTVDAWKGGYKREVVMTTTYRIDHYDFCSGALLWSENQKSTDDETIPFNIINPNLGDGLPSYVSNAPLTDDEAQAALPEALTNCEALHTGAWPQGSNEH